MKNNFTNDDQLISLSEFSEFMFHASVPIEDIMDYKGNPILQVFPYWRRHGLLPFIPKGKWNIKISFAQLIWLRILDTLREFSVSLSSSKMVCDYFFKNAYEDELPKWNLTENKKAIEERIATGTTLDNDEHTLAEINRMLSDDLLLNGLKFEINYLTKLITECIASQSNAGFIVFTNGQVFEYIDDKYYSNRKEQDELDLNQPHIKLSIKHYLKEFIQKEELQKLFVPSILNNNEKEVLKALRQKDTTITIKKQKGEIVKIESSIDGVFSDNDAAKIRQLLGIGNYQQITISTRNNKTLVFKKVRKKYSFQIPKT
jgi:hypothetical protein